MPKEPLLSVFEKKFLLYVERGEVAEVRRIVDVHKNNSRFNINCTDPLGRSALVVAIENENVDMMELLLKNGIQAKDALLHAIDEENVEGVEVLLRHEEKIHVSGKPYSWEAVDVENSSFTRDITPLILAAHRDNYEILKLLLDRGATLPMPHDVRCACDECVQARREDCLRHSHARINAYRALSSPSLISLSSSDPILAAFHLSWDLRRLVSIDHEFQSEYTVLCQKCEDFATSLLDHTRTSYELEVMLNYDPEGPAYQPGGRLGLARLKLAITYGQKKFVAHPNVQQLLASVWYEGMPGFRRKNPIGQFLEIFKLGSMFPLYSLAYILAPSSRFGQTMKKPFIKFICHSASYCFFLFLLMVASQRIDMSILQMFESKKWHQWIQNFQLHERGAPPRGVEIIIIFYVAGFIWCEIKQLWDSGLEIYIGDMWNILDFICNMLYLAWIGLRVAAWYLVQKDLENGIDAYTPREKWHPFDPMLISEGMFGAANIFSFLKMVHIFSVNPHLGPLQISLGRMVFDIVKFFFIYTLVLFAFACGLNQLLCYYAEMDRTQCYSNQKDNERSCEIWRRFSNLFETSQSLFWASFGLVDINNFELTGIKSYTRFWGLLMFGTYSVINVVVLLNLLIAMMSNSYQIISERSDREWKFARSKLWMSYFEEGGTVPPPFNIVPTMKSLRRLFGFKRRSRSSSLKVKEEHDRDSIYHAVMRCLVRRYVTNQQKKAEESEVTEDDVNEIKQSVSAFKSELFEILRNNGMTCSKTCTVDREGGRKERLRERRLLKDFTIGMVESVVGVILKERRKSLNTIMLRKLTGKRTNAQKNWNILAAATRNLQNQIGKSDSSCSGSLSELRNRLMGEVSPIRSPQAISSDAAHEARALEGWEETATDNLPLSESKDVIEITPLVTSTDQTAEYDNAAFAIDDHNSGGIPSRVTESSSTSDSHPVNSSCHRHTVLSHTYSHSLRAPQTYESRDDSILRSSESDSNALGMRHLKSGSQILNQSPPTGGWL